MEDDSMSQQKLSANMTNLAAGIQVCMDRQLQLPTLILLYTAIDVAAWIANDDPDAKVGKRFMAWVDGYMLKAKPMHCTAADLYGARCGVLHTLTPDSDMSDAGKARRICYAWGDRSADEMQKLIARVRTDSLYVWVHVGEVLEAWRLGIKLLEDEMAKDAAKAARIYARTNKFFDEASTEKLDWILARSKETEP
jgi:hypothetical protein